MERINAFPQNREHFLKLLGFCKVILEICRDIGIDPVVHGSLAYFAHIRDSGIKVNDIDMSVPEESFPRITEAAKNKGYKCKLSREWHMLQVFDGNLLIELDSIDHIFKDTPRDFEEFDFHGTAVKVASLKTQAILYKRSSRDSKSRPNDYKEKYMALSRKLNG